MSRMQTPLGRISYPHIFTPKTETDQKTGVTKSKYQCALLFDSSANLQALIDDAFQEGVKEFGEHFWQLVQQRSVRWPFRDGGEINPNTGQPRYGQGITFVNCSSYDKPDVVSRWAEPGSTKPRKVTDPSELYPGEYCKASVTIKPYNRQDGKGIAVYVNALQLWHEGDRLDNRVDGQDAFDAEGEAPAAPMDGAPQHAPAGPTPGNYAAPPPHNPQQGGGGGGLL